MEELMLKIDNVTKQYRLGQIGGTTLKAELQRLSAKLHGREDPYHAIGMPVQEKNEKFLALKGVSIEVKKGERVGIIGHNGAGKSTLLKLISRVTGPTSGTISLNGRVASMLEVGTGFHGELTGRENIYMNGAILGMTKKEIDSKIEQIIDFSEVRQFIDTPVKRYSSGMYVKLAFSVAAHLDSEIMIMDEVLAVGDMAFQKKCLDKMNDVSRQQGRTILYVSHNMNTIRQLCDRVVVLDKGLVVFDGGVEEGIETYLHVHDDSSVSFDFQTPERDKWKFELEMLGIDFIDRATNRIARGEDLDFVLHCKANADVRDLFFRAEVFSASGNIVGAAFSDKSIAAKKGESVDIVMTLPTEHLAPGRFFCAAVLYRGNSYGAQRFSDRVDPAFTFELQNREDDELVWLQQQWGNVRLDDMRIRDIRTKG